MSYCYVIECGDFWKFGFSANPRKRVLAIQTGNPITCILYNRVKCYYARELEYAIHNYLSDYRCNGEWFEKSPISNYIADNLHNLHIITSKLGFNPPKHKQANFSEPKQSKPEKVETKTVGKPKEGNGLENPERVRERARQWQKDNPERYRAYMREYMKAYRKRKQPQ